MIYYPLQGFGIGDIIFTQTLLKIIADGNKILWGTESHLVDGLNQAYPGVTFVDKGLMKVDYNRKDDYELNGMRILPIRWSYAIMNVPYTECMSSKYELYGCDWRDWKKDAMWVRNPAREQELFDWLKLKEGESYTLVNRFFGTESQHVANIKVRGVDFRTLGKWSLFDWAKVIENAEYIHSVSTSLLYLFELLDLKAKEVHLYPRHPIEEDFRNVDYLFTKNYTLHA